MKWRFCAHTVREGSGVWKVAVVSMVMVYFGQVEFALGGGCECNGDANGDGVIDLADVVTVNSCVGSLPESDCAASDINCDGLIDRLDRRAAFCTLFDPFDNPRDCCDCCNADINQDGDVDIADIAALGACLDSDPPVGECWRSDVNCDAVVNQNDLESMDCFVFGGAEDCCACPCNFDCDGDGVFSAGDVQCVANCEDRSPTGECGAADVTCDGFVGSTDIGAMSCFFDSGENCCCPAPIIVQGAGSRYVRIDPAPGDFPIALRVTGNPADPCHACLDMWVQEDGSLSDVPIYQTPDQWGTVYVTGQEIVPGRAYLVQQDCGSPTAVNLSDPIVGVTYAWADVDNNGIVNLADVFAVILCFAEGFEPQCDLGPAIPNRLVNLADAFSAILVFQGGGYPFDGPCLPEACP